MYNKFYKLILIILLFPFVIFASSKKLSEKVCIPAFKISEEIKLDGVLSENVWKNNHPISDFTQREPREGAIASEKTEVWVAYDESAIYVAAKLYDSSPDSITALLSRRDNFNESDWFGFFIDPYHDKRTGYQFGVNPAGSILDGTLFNDSWDDNSWNGIWEYATKIDTDGWNVEIRIPFTQLRFNESDNMNWGINFYRKIQRKNEEDFFIMVPKKESGFVSHFATLEGLKGVESKPRLEILPYMVSKAQYLVHEPNDPFYKSKQYKTAFGADIKYGLGSSLTLDATINPDFGQVELDPATVNLSTFETYYEEKRPFFIEGNNIFYFGYGGSNNNWGFNWGNPKLFYSRRIGRQPHLSVDSDGYVDIPNETRILGAAKITGKLNDNWSLGFINAITERTYANIINNGNGSSQQVEPLSNYTIFRTQKEFNSGKSAIGFMGTSTIRDLSSVELKNELSDRAFVYGMDGWITLDNDETYVLTGFASGSYSHGNKNYLIKLQESSIRYLQRPDAVFFRLDSNRTSLSGYTARVTLNKQKGNFYINSALGVISPGYETNDVGFQWNANLINSHLVLGYRWFEPDNIFRQKQIYLAHFRSYNYDGNLVSAGVMFFTNLQFSNYYKLNLNGGYFPETYNTRLTRGGPIAKNPPSMSLNYNIQSDSREKIVAVFNGGNSWDKLGASNINIGTSISWKPNSNINLSFGPFYEKNFETMQWVDQFNDQYAANTFDRRYVFAELNQKTIGGNIRLDWTFTPALSLQLFVQPLISVGRYKHFKELAKPGTYKTNEYGQNGSTISYNHTNEEYTVDPDTKGPASAFTFSNPDFNFKSIRGNLVLRWEFLPGSVLFFVWTHDKTNEDNPGSISFSRDFNSLWNSPSNNVFLLKFSYWLNM